MDSLVSKYYTSSGIGQYFSEDMLPYLSIVRFSPGEYIFHQGDSSNKLLFLLEGKVKYCYTLPNGRELVYNRETGSEFIGDLEFLGVWGETISVRAVEECLCFLVDTDKAGDRVRRDPAFLMSVIRKMSEGSRELSAQRFSGARSGVSIETRLARHILRREQDGFFREKRTETADHLYITCRYLMYILADFCEKGYVQRQGRAIKILDRDALISLANNL